MNFPSYWPDLPCLLVDAKRGAGQPEDRFQESEKMRQRRDHAGGRLGERREVLGACDEFKG